VVSRMGTLNEPELLAALLYGPFAVALLLSLLTLRALLSHLLPHGPVALAAPAGKGLLLTAPAAREPLG
jgi:hypothetical protein